MFPGIMIVVLLLVLSGAVAYVGDLLGRRFGKKKVSIAGLRPKYTSIIITIVSGVMITAITLGAMLLVSQYVRTAMFGLQQLESERATARRDLQGARKEIKHSLERNKKTQAELAALQQKLDRDSTRLEELSSEIENKNQDLDAAHGALVKVEATLARADEDVARLTAELARLEQERAALVRRKETLESEILNMSVQLSEAQKDILHGDIIYNKHQPLARFFVSPDIARQDLEDNLNESLSVLEATARETGAVLGPDAAMFRKLQIDKVWASVQDAQEDVVVEARSATNVLRGEPFYLELTPRRNRVLFRQGEAVASAPVPAHADEQAVRDILSALLSEVMEEARGRGILPDLKTAMVGTMTVARFQEALAQATDADSPATLVLFAARDTRAADKLHVDYRIE